jgi:hypothetical protein
MIQKLKDGRIRDSKTGKVLKDAKVIERPAAEITVKIKNKKTGKIWEQKTNIIRELNETKPITNADIENSVKNFMKYDAPYYFNDPVELAGYTVKRWVHKITE